MSAEKTSAFLDGFEHDVFISYAHQDNGEGWIEDFRKTLLWRIDHHLGCRGKLSVFRDEDSLSRNQLVTHSLPLACQESAVLVCVVSANYLKSDWCRRELVAFQERMEGRSLRGRAVPVFQVTIMEVNRDALPHPLCDLNAYPYFQAKPANPDLNKTRI